MSVRPDSRDRWTVVFPTLPSHMRFPSRRETTRRRGKLPPPPPPPWIFEARRGDTMRYYRRPVTVTVTRALPAAAAVPSHRGDVPYPYLDHVYHRTTVRAAFTAYVLYNASGRDEAVHYYGAVTTRLYWFFAAAAAAPGCVCYGGGGGITKLTRVRPRPFHPYRVAFLAANAYATRTPAVVTGGGGGQFVYYATILLRYTRGRTTERNERTRPPDGSSLNLSLRPLLRRTCTAVRYSRRLGRYIRNIMYSGVLRCGIVYGVSHAEGYIIQ